MTHDNDRNYSKPTPLSNELVEGRQVFAWHGKWVDIPKLWSSQQMKDILLGSPKPNKKNEPRRCTWSFLDLNCGFTLIFHSDIIICYLKIEWNQFAKSSCSSFWGKKTVAVDPKNDDLFKCIMVESLVQLPFLGACRTTSLNLKAGPQNYRKKE